MKAIVKTPFPGVPDGEVYPRDFRAGDEVCGSLAAIAVREGWAEEPKEAAPARITTKPNAAAELNAAILAAAASLDPKDGKSFAQDGRPQVKALEAALGYDVSADERDAAWASRQA